jgi:ribonuclease P protein component
MLPAAQRLRRPAEFALAVRRGRRAGRPLLVVHVFAPESSAASSRPAQVGFVVSRSVGGSVVRNRVKRRLRHLMAARTDQLPVGANLVVRAQSAASTATSAELAGDLDRALARVLS